MSQNGDFDDDFEFDFSADNNADNTGNQFTGDSEFNFNLDSNNTLDADNFQAEGLTTDFSNSAFFDEPVDNTQQFNQGVASQEPQQQAPQQQASQHTESVGKSSKKTIGITIFVVLLLLALILSFVTKIKITKTPKSSKQTIAQQDDKLKVADQQIRDLENQVADLSSQLQESEAKRSKLESNRKVVKADTNSENSDLDGEELGSDEKTEQSEENKGMWQEIDASSVNFDSEELDTDGNIIAKHVYLSSDNQLIYSLEVGVDKSITPKCSVLYYCPLNIYLKVREGDSVLLKYRKSGSSISIVSLQK